MPASKQVDVRIGETLIMNVRDEAGNILDVHAITIAANPEAPMPQERKDERYAPPVGGKTLAMLALLADLLGPDEATPGCDCPACTAMRQKH